MRSQLVIRAAALAVALLVGGSGARADEREERDRKARAALALTATPAPKAVAKVAAPKPREVGAGYATAYARALEQVKPLVVYVGCKSDHKAPGAVAAKADALPGVTGPAAVVMYPLGDGVRVHRVMQCPVDEAELGKAIKDAAGKIDGKGKASDKAAPKPLDWNIRHEAPRDARTELDVLRDSFVRVRTEQFGGSGVVAWSEPGRSLVFTCWHVIESGGPIVVRTGGATLPARVLEVDRAADLALLEVARELPQVAAVEAEEPAEGDEVVMLGAASIWSKGNVIGTGTANGKPSAQGDFEGYSGDSGGPVFRKGALIGIARSVDGKGRARFSTRLDGMLVRGIKRERAPVVAAPKVLPVVSAAPDCPNGKCPLPSPFAGPVIQGGCANGQCDAPSYGRGGLFRRR